MSTKIEEAKVYENDIDNDRLGIDTEIEAES